MLMDVYRDDEGSWRWQIISRNGRIIVRSPAAYVRKKACVDIATKIARGITRISVEP